MKEIKSVNVDNEIVHLKKDGLGWRVVHPLKNADGTWNWFNVCFGSKSNLVFLIIMLLVGIGFWVGVNELLSTYKTIALNPCDYCECASKSFGLLK